MARKPTWRELYEVAAERLDESRQKNFDLQRRYHDEMRGHIAALEKSATVSATLIDLLRLTQRLVRSVAALKEEGRSDDLDEFFADAEEFMRNITLH
jgi:hypothetical protein